MGWRKVFHWLIIDNIEVDLEHMEQLEVYMNLPSTTAAPFTAPKLQPRWNQSSDVEIWPDVTWYLGSNGCRKVRTLSTGWLVKCCDWDRFDIQKRVITRWWFQICVCFHPEAWGNDPIWRAYFSVFQMGWNHQLENQWPLFNFWMEFWDMPISSGARHFEDTSNTTIDT